MNKEQIEEVKKPEISGWEININENGVVMATINRDKLIELVKYIEYLESKREEIERKAYNSGVLEGKKRERGKKRLIEPTIVTYDQWKESQNQEHGI